MVRVAYSPSVPPSAAAMTVRAARVSASSKVSDTNTSAASRVKGVSSWRLQSVDVHGGLAWTTTVSGCSASRRGVCPPPGRSRRCGHGSPSGSPRCQPLRSASKLMQSAAAAGRRRCSSRWAAVRSRRHPATSCSAPPDRYRRASERNDLRPGAIEPTRTGEARRRAAHARRRGDPCRPARLGSDLDGLRQRADARTRGVSVFCRGPGASWATRLDPGRTLTRLGSEEFGRNGCFSNICSIA
jgi:hypothetical protein